MGPLENILVIDDDPLSLRLLTGVLRGGPWQVTSCSDSLAALRLVASQRFRAVVCDVDMPGSDGLDVLRRVRFQDPACAVVLVTGHAAVPEDPAAGKPDLLLHKPVDKDRLRAFLAGLPAVGG